MNSINQTPTAKPKQIIARKFVLYLLLSTAIISILGTSFNIYLEYNSQLKTIENRLNDIKKANYDSIVNALWVSDEQQINIILMGIKQLPDIEYIEIIEDEETIFSFGDNKLKTIATDNHIIRSYPLNKDYLGKQINLGTMTIHVSLEGLFSNLITIGVNTLYFAIIQIIILTLIIFFVFYHLVGRHLAAMAEYTRTLKLEELGPPLELERNGNDTTATDELSHLVNSINDMRANLKTSQKSINQLLTSLTKSEEKFRGVLESSADGVVLVNTHGEIELINNAIVKMTGYDNDELIGEKIEKLIPNRFNQHAEHRNRYLKNPIIRPMGKDIFLILKRKDNTEFPIEISLTPVETDEGIIVAAMIQDITDRKKAEQEKEKLLQSLENKNAELERFTYTASHDLKSPLVTISGFIGLLRKDIAAGDMDRVDTDLVRINDATKTMQRLLEDLLALSRIGRATTPRVSISLNNLIDDVLELLDGVIKSTGTIITVEQNLPRIMVEEQRFKEVFLNLIENAIKYRQNDITPTINIGIRHSDTTNVFFVSDNGIGIKPCYHHKVFGLFDRLNQEAEGSGIGLAIVKRIIEVHGGAIWVESNRDNQGSTFCFTIDEE